MDELIMTINVTTYEGYCVKGGKMKVYMVPFTAEAEGKYFRYGGSYTIFAFKAIKPFCIKDTKWGKTEVNDYLWQ